MLRAKKPVVSNVFENLAWPAMEMVLCDGFIAKMPVYDAGRMMLPPDCTPMLRETCISAAAAAEPAAEPSGVRRGHENWLLRARSLEHRTNSVVVVLPRMVVS